MKINYKDIIQIITISIVLSFFRYLFLEDYPILKKSKLEEVNLDVSELDSLHYLNIGKARLITTHNLIDHLLNE